MLIKDEIYVWLIIDLYRVKNVLKSFLDMGFGFYL